MRIFFSFLCLAFYTVCNAQVINQTFFFDSGKDILKEKDKLRIDSVSSVALSAKSYSIVIRAYSDADGSAKSNLVLAQSRGKSVMNELVNDKINAQSITIIAVGEDEPLGDNSSAAGKAMNRRVKMAITYQPQESQIIEKEQKRTETTSSDKSKESATTSISSAKLEVGKTLILKNLNFEGGTPVLLPESEPVLKDLLKLMQDNPTLEIEIGGHVCCGPDYELSVARAKKVYNYLKNYGISEKRMTYKGYSFDKPIASERTEEGRIANRRVEITILKIE